MARPRLVFPGMVVGRHGGHFKVRLVDGQVLVADRLCHPDLDHPGVLGVGTRVLVQSEGPEAHHHARHDVQHWSIYRPRGPSD